MVTLMNSCNRKTLRGLKISCLHARCLNHRLTRLVNKSPLIKIILVKTTPTSCLISQIKLSIIGQRKQIQINSRNLKSSKQGWPWITTSRAAPCAKQNLWTTRTALEDTNSDHAPTWWTFTPASKRKRNRIFWEEIQWAKQILRAYKRSTAKMVKHTIIVHTEISTISIMAQKLQLIVYKLKILPITKIEAPNCQTRRNS